MIIVLYFVFLRDRKLAVVLTQELVRMSGVPALGWILFSPRAGQASLSLSCLVSQRLRGDRNHVAFTEVWSYGVGTGREGGKRAPQGGEGGNVQEGYTVCLPESPGLNT